MRVVRNESTKPKVPDTMNGTPSRVGLKRVRVTTPTPALFDPPARCLSASDAPVEVISARRKASALPASGASPPS